MEFENYKPEQLSPSGIPYIEEVFSKKEVEEVDKWIAIYHNRLLFFRERESIRKFKEFDEVYAHRIGLTIDELFELQLRMVKKEASRQASLAFTETQNVFNDTMFNYAEDERVAAYNRFEKKFIEKYMQKKIREEKSFSFKSFVACSLGLNRR